MQDLYSDYFNKKLYDIQFNNRLAVIICNTKYYDTCVILSCHEIKVICKFSWSGSYFFQILV